MSCHCYLFDEGWLGEGMKLIVVMIGKEVVVVCEVIDGAVIAHSIKRVGGTRVETPEDIFAFNRGSFGLGDVENHHFETIR